MVHISSHIALSLPANAVKLIIFDCDGTLVDSQFMIVAAMTRAWAEHDLGEPQAAAVRRVVGLSLVEAVARLLPGETQERCEQVANSYKLAFGDLRRQQAHDEPLFSGVLETLTLLNDSGFLLGVATGKSRRGLNAVLDKYDLNTLFVTTQTADDAPGKPHPGMIRQAMAETGVLPGETLMIGDTSFDIEMARNAGVAALGVAWGYHAPEELMQAGAAGVLDQLADLSALLLPNRAGI